MHVQNVHTMDELKMTGNCLRGSRGLLSFDGAFEATEWGRLVKELFTQVGYFTFNAFSQNHSLTTSSRSLLSIRGYGSGISK